MASSSLESSSSSSGPAVFHAVSTLLSVRLRLHVISVRCGVSAVSAELDISAVSAELDGSELVMPLPNALHDSITAAAQSDNWLCDRAPFAAPEIAAQGPVAWPSPRGQCAHEAYSLMVL